MPFKAKTYRVGLLFVCGCDVANNETASFLCHLHLNRAQSTHPSDLDLWQCNTHGTLFVDRSIQIDEGKLVVHLAGCNYFNHLFTLK